jgi:hypothetical protein
MCSNQRKEKKAKRKKTKERNKEESQSVIKYMWASLREITMMLVPVTVLLYYRF